MVGLLVNNELEGSGGGLTLGNIPEFAWRDEENHRNPQSVQQVSGPRY
jgi:hypothetical protein